MSAERANYRSISLTSIVCKILEGILRDKLVTFFIINNLKTTEQHGFVTNPCYHKSFVPRKGCVSNLLETLNFVTEDLSRGDSVDEVMLKSF